MAASDPKGVFQLLVADIERRKRAGEISLEQAGAEFREALNIYIQSLPEQEAIEVIDRLALTDLELERQARALGLKVAGRDRTDVN